MLREYGIIEEEGYIPTKSSDEQINSEIATAINDIKAIGTDPRAWSLIVDGSGDFESDQVRFSPMSILDIEVIRKADDVRYIETTCDGTGIMGLRVVRGRLEYTRNGFNWEPIKIGHRHIIRDEEGTGPNYFNEDEDIEEEN